MKIAVFGAGLVGSLYATLMAKLGHEVTIYEKRSDIRSGFTGRARSINLALSVRGWKALELAGLRAQVEKIVIPMEGRMIHQVGKETSLQPYSQYGKTIFSVSRNDLNELLINEAEAAGCEFIFDSKVLPCNEDDDLITLEAEDGTIYNPQADLFIGADGANSITRSYIKGCRYKVDKISHNYKEIEIPADSDGNHKLYKQALHIWPRGTFMLIGLPNTDGSYTGTLFMPENGKNSFKELNTRDKVSRFFESTFPDTGKHVPNLVDQFIDNPTSNLATMWVDDWYDEEKKIGLIGDAAHGIIPFYGQGMNAGFEDCSILFELLQKEDFGQHFTSFAASRKVDTDGIANLSRDNFIEMRDLVAQPKFQLQKKIERKIQSAYPDTWMPLYTMVSFSHIPYGQVYERGQKQQLIMNEVLKIKEIEEKSTQDELHSDILSILAFHNILEG